MRSNFNSSRLQRLLDAATPAPAEAPRLDVAERLGDWLHAFDAVTLHAVHQSLQAEAPARAGHAEPAAVARALAEQVQRVHAALAQAVVPPADDEVPADYARYRQRHLELQRQMESAIGPLRAQVRQALAKAAPRLRQLAALDAVWEQMLAGREQRLLGGIPGLLQQRFAQLRKTTPAQALREEFGREWQDVLLAEVELRLEPLMGLLDAFNDELEKIQ